jgi:hypothetical protein
LGGCRSSPPKRPQNAIKEKAKTKTKNLSLGCPLQLKFYQESGSIFLQKAQKNLHPKNHEKTTRDFFLDKIFARGTNATPKDGEQRKPLYSPSFASLIVPPAPSALL